jgi:hypothetical protein
MSAPQQGQPPFALDEAEERELEERQARRNRILGWTLAALVLLIIAVTIYKMQTGAFNPFEDQDLFRS